MRLTILNPLQFSNQIYNSFKIKSNQIKCWFLRRGENRSTRRKTSRSRVENQQTQPTYDAESGNRTRDTLVEGERSHHCANPAPQILCKRNFHQRMTRTSFSETARSRMSTPANHCFNENGWLATWFCSLLSKVHVSRD